MRAIAVSVWIFINLVFFGMCGYIYLLWSQYWHYITRRQQEAQNELQHKVDNRPLVDYYQVNFYYYNLNYKVRLALAQG